MVSLAPVEGYDISTYGDRIAEVYDDLFGAGVLDIDGTIQLLDELAAGGSVLELAIGTGRVGLPLARRGISISGVDASTAMVAKLRAKTGGADIPVAIGDFAEVPVEGTFSLIYIVFNTFFALASQEDQLRCFRNVVRHLEDDGLFLIECFVPDVTRFDRGQRVNVLGTDLERVVLDVSTHDPVDQTITNQHIVVTENGIKLYPVHLRYAYPPELDLMARSAGLRLRDRWGGWRRQPFGARSDIHVSLYERA